MQKLLAFLMVCGMLTICLFSDDVSQTVGLSLWATRWILGLTTLVIIVAIPSLIPDPLLTRLQHESNRESTPVGEFTRLGLGTVTHQDDTRSCYLDLLQRALTNVLYEDLSLMSYDKSRVSSLTEGFDLERRCLGEDVPWQAHTMVGWKRLNNTRHCVETAIVEKIPGDFVELGVLRGGASIMIRGVMHAYGDTERKVYACDTYVSRPKLSAFTRRFLLSLVSMFASIPIRPLQRWICTEYIRKSGSFPAVHDPSDELIDMTLFTLLNVSLLSYHCGTGLDDVKSNFARYGLLDDQVAFLKGYFSDTLPNAPIEKLAMMRLDGDTFESTRDVLAILYARLSPGGFCIVDDYYSFIDCQKAVDSFREQNGIVEEIVRIDNHGVYWRKGTSEMT